MVVSSTLNPEDQSGLLSRRPATARLVRCDNTAMNTTVRDEKRKDQPGNIISCSVHNTGVSSVSFLPFGDLSSLIDVVSYSDQLPHVHRVIIVER